MRVRWCNALFTVYFLKLYWREKKNVHFRNVLSESVWTLDLFALFLCHTLLCLFQKVSSKLSTCVSEKKKRKKKRKEIQNKRRWNEFVVHIMISRRLVRQSPVISKHLALFPCVCVCTSEVCEKESVFKIHIVSSSIESLFHPHALQWIYNCKKTMMNWKQTICP